MTTPSKIRKEKPRMDVRAALDIMGANFRDQVAGMAEWLKNSVDAYIREDTPDNEQYVVIHLRMPGRRPQDWEFEVIDFVGADFKDIHDDLMEWCSPTAASKGGKFEVYGGHGNGGKFHMRENFRQADFYTYRNGSLTVLGFEDKDYGFNPKYEGAEELPAKAMKIAGLDLDILPKAVRAKFDHGDIHFTLVRGYGPRPAPKWKDYREFIQKLQRNGQAKQLLDRASVTVAVNGKTVIPDLDAPKIPAKHGFEKIAPIEIPAVLTLDGEQVRLLKDGSPGQLTLRTSADPFPASGADAALNSIDIRGKVGIIASYRIAELPGIRNFPGGRFVYGECHCPVLEQLGCKENDRKRLAENDASLALLRWIAAHVDKLAGKLIEHEDRAKIAAQSEVTRRLNALLNKWKNQFLEKLFVEVTVGPGVGPGFGGAGGGGAGGGAGGGGGGAGGGGEGNKGGGAGDEGRKKAPKFPLVLVSGHNPDPDTEEQVILDPRNEVIYQRPVDIARNIWWINGQRPLAHRLLSMPGGATSERFRDYLLQRYVDIIQTYVLGKKWAEGQEINPDVVTSWMLETIGRLHDSAARDLEDFMFGAAAGPGAAAEPA